MADQTRIRFKRPKRFPHPNGPRRSPGDEVLADSGLAERWADRGIVETVGADTTEGGDGDSLEEHTVDDLRALADEHDVNLGGATRKAEIVDALRNAGVSG